MKVRYVKKDDRYPNYNLTLGNIYDVYVNNRSYYNVLNDIGNVSVLFTHEVEVVNECVSSDPIVESVINQFKTRSEVGIKKYGTTLERNDLSTLDWLKHLQEEMMDAVLYIEKLKSEL